MAAHSASASEQPNSHEEPDILFFPPPYLYMITRAHFLVVETDSLL